ncbi:tRNA (uracil-5-)-methyltransferase homolog A-like [Diaphorina citri]|uniref:tRNA (Uracil-5-)-methyltransferase homolog A-like n=1 Tax=Diaphorina citri TaxID=121845 RepID=A0A1S4EEE8_DIACI|nr:tRNA (uracil-5-)-methyltransferase homolog A-like [Diaphorina citri]
MSLQAAQKELADRPVQAKKNKNLEAAKIQRAISKNVNKAIEEELRSRAISKEKPHLSTKRNHPPEPKPAQFCNIKLQRGHLLKLTSIQASHPLDLSHVSHLLPDQVRKHQGKDNTEEKPDANKEEFAYSKRGDFTSEVYKIIVRGLPKYFGISEVRKHFETFLNTKLCKLIPLNKKRNRWNDSGVFITFYDEKTRQHALTKLNGYRFKGKVLSAVKANALPDPFIMKQKAEKAAEDLQKQSEMCTEEKLKDCTIPLWNMPYEEQLELKMSDMRKQVVEMIHSIERYQPALKPWFDRQREINNGLPVQLDQIRPCKRPEGYRNKCEFSIGLHPQTKEKTVGFRYGKYSEGSVYIGPVYNLIHIHDRMKAVVRVFENYVRGSRFDIFDVVTQGGHWKLLMCRYSDSSESNLKIQKKVERFDPQDLPEEELNKVREELKDFFENSDEGKEIRCASVNFQLMPRR